LKGNTSAGKKVSSEDGAIQIEAINKSKGRGI